MWNVEIPVLSITFERFKRRGWWDFISLKEEMWKSWQSIQQQKLWALFITHYYVLVKRYTKFWRDKDFVLQSSNTKKYHLTRPLEISVSTNFFCRYDTCARNGLTNEVPVHRGIWPIRAASLTMIKRLRSRRARRMRHFILMLLHRSNFSKPVYCSKWRLISLRMLE